MSTWTTDLRHLPPRSEAGNSAPSERRAEHVRQLVAAATSRHAGRAWPSAVRCIGRAPRKTCGAWIEVTRVGDERIEWSCPKCGESGIITGFAGTPHDMQPYIPRKKAHLWGVDQESRDRLYAHTGEIPAMRAVVSRASPVVEVPGFLRIDATIDELDEIYTLVEQLWSILRSRRQREILDDLLQGLCGAMDRF